MTTDTVETLPNGMIRCTMTDGSTYTLDADNLDKWLREHPMKEEPPAPWYSRILKFFSPTLEK